MSRMSAKTLAIPLGLALTLILQGMAAAQPSGAEAAAFARLAPADDGQFQPDETVGHTPPASGQKVAAPVSKWISTSMPWFLLPSGDAVGPLPKTITIRPVAWDYDVRSERVEVFGKTQPTILRVTLRVKSGSVGVVLVSSDGSAIVSNEATLRPSGDDAQVYFRVRPATPPSVIVIRNYDGAGETGSVTLKGMQFVREVDLSNDELTAIVDKGLH